MLTKGQVEAIPIFHPVLKSRIVELCDDWLAMRAMLEKLEWGGIDYVGFGSVAVCPRCNSDQRQGHWADCKLKELLDDEREKSD